MAVLEFCTYLFFFVAAKPSEQKDDSPMLCYFVLQEKAQCLQKAVASQADKSTQTELLVHDVSSCIEQYCFLIIFMSVQSSISLLVFATVASVH